MTIMTSAFMLVNFSFTFNKDVGHWALTSDNDPDTGVCQCSGLSQNINLNVNVVKS